MPRRSPLPPWPGENPPKPPSIREQYSRHLVDVKCITLHLVFYAFPARTKRVNPSSRPDFKLSALDEASEYDATSLADRMPTRFSPADLPRRGERQPANLRFALAPHRKARKVAQPLDSSPAMPPLQRPFSVQLCGRLWIVRKSGTPWRPMARRCPFALV